MASSMLTGDRRWGQTRKSSLTVLGKVPKPINLPSQRLENHGLDPNVEIVPKGTLTWGSRSSLSTPNAWGSSSVSSPNTDGSTASPSCLSGRPSSAGGFTRPSTAASERSHQAVSTAWGPNSRPSSASGILPSNQITASVTRPRSAETRPGSSQLSCFAEPVAESSAWGATRIAEKLVPASKSNNFTLSSGDFPTLGSEKNSKSNVVQQGHSSQGRPASASGRASAQKETTEPTPVPPGNQAMVHCLDKGNVNTWRKDNSPCTGSSAPPSSGNWHRDQQQTQPYPQANVPSHHFDTWHGPPMQSSPDGIWYRGGPPGGLYRSGGPTGSYPIESYIYYPQLPARPLPNSQAGPRHGTVVSGYGPTNGAPYHPRAPDSYMVPNHTIGSMRPEVYPRQLSYSPTPNFGNDNGNSNEQDGPVLGMSPFPSHSNQHLNQNSNVDPGGFPALPCYYGPSMSTKQVEDGHTHESHGPQYKVLLKQHDACKDNESEENKDQSVTDSMAQLETRDHLGASRPAQKKGGKDELLKMGLDGTIFHPPKGSEVHSSILTVQKNVAISTKSETADDQCANAAGQGEDPQRYSVKKSSGLIEKIESLNNKARLADGRCVEEEKKRAVKNVNIKVDPTNVANTSTILSEKYSTEKVSSGGDMEKVSTGDTNLKSTVDVKAKSGASEVHSSAVGLLDPSDISSASHSQIHRRVHSKQNKADFHTKTRFDSQDGEEWRKKSPGRDSTVLDSIVSCPELKVQDCQPCQDASEKKELHEMKVGDEPYSLSSMDPVDYKAQHAKMREIARQRAKQLQKEEEERIREQKARALAKLEELNRRTIAESSNQTLHHAPIIETDSGQDARMCPDSKANTVASEALSFNSDPTNTMVQKDDKVTTVPSVSQTSEGLIMIEESVESSPKAALLAVTLKEPSMSPMQDVIKTEGKPDSLFRDNKLSNEKQMPHKRQDKHSEERRVLEKNVSMGVLVGSIIVGSKSLAGSIPPSSSAGDGLPSNDKDMDEPSMQHRRRNNRASRNKNKLDEAPLTTISQSAHRALENVATECCKPKPSESVVEVIPVVSETSNEVVGGLIPSDVTTTSPNQGASQVTTEGPPRKATVQWKPQPARRVTRNLQGAKSVDKFHGTEAVVWAPVGSANKKELSEELQKVSNKLNPDSSGKSGNNVELNLKYKRAEMERYVPKPIAKEVSQQAKPRLSSLSQHQTESGLKVEQDSQGTTDSGGLDHPVTLNVGVLADTKNWESSKHSKHSRTHTSWRRRSPPESASPSPGLLEGLSPSDSNKSSQKTSCEQPLKHDDPQEQPKSSDDGWNDDNNYLVQCESTIAPSGEKHHAKMNRGRRQHTKGQKVVGNNSSFGDNWEPGHGRTDKAASQMMTIEADELAGRNGKRSENQGVTDHPRSQWQPKSQACSTPSHSQGTRGTEVQKVVSESDRFDKESLLPGGENHCQPVEGKSDSTTPVSAELRNVRQHEGKRERSVGGESSMKQEPTANQDSLDLSELGPQNAGPQNERVPSGTRRHGQRNGWFARGNETSFGGSYGPGQDTGKHNLPANVDRRKHYQRGGYYDKHDDSLQHNPAVSEGARDGSKPVGKYRERGHNNPRRGGHFYSRNRTSDAYGNGE